MARISPLHGFGWPACDGLRLAETPFLTQVNVRLDAKGAAADAVAAALGTPLPVEPNSTAAAGDLTALWLGPDEWLVVAAAGVNAGLIEALHQAAAAEPMSIVDVSAQRTAVDVTGARAAALLAHGCALDLDPRSFRLGRCAQTLLAHTAVVLVGIDDGYRILVRASYARHLAGWLTDAAAEWIRLP